MGCAPRRCQRRAFSLTETVAATLAAGILLAGATSFLTAYVRWTARCRAEAEQKLSVALGLERFHVEMQQARRVLSLGSSWIEFAHPDVTGDGADDIIRWSWSGSGAPFTRTVNPSQPGSEAVPVLEAVQSLKFDYWTKTNSFTREVGGVPVTENRTYLVLVLLQAQVSSGKGVLSVRDATAPWNQLDITGL
jgi:type II secretory pathway pseudopilin PulG